MIEERLDEATFTDDEQVRIHIIHELARYPHDVRNALVELFRKRKRHLYPVVSHVIRAIGYPDNASTVRLLLDFVGDKNSVVWQEAVQLLVQLGIQEITPHIIQFLWRRDSHQYWGDDVEGICAMLTQVDQVYAAQCGPTLAHILGRDDLPPPRELDLSFLLDVLEKVGAACAEYALPSLLHLLQKEGASDVGKQAYRLITSFEKEKLAPYTLLLPEASEMQSTDDSQ